ncbi:monolysocardiolipin acyltransferase [Geosmithia morbida]|uniref:Tafazzin family protein n=1 Tax=Geosmithia morbida TaxID=1094350 RepID=A0A9P4YVI2_9HYPO|nr:monolysocardiolipin acyltransferase [Geosmithia morbida]KAF4123297.1 monolysocardiolipin acyltransferase [Geosmithia morbida]
MSGPAPPTRPGLPWRLASVAVMSTVGAASRGFLYGLNNIETTGLDKFLELLDQRKAVDIRPRGLLTVCNHVGVLDDPIIWGVLPFRYSLDPENLRWSLGAHDICFKNKYCPPKMGPMARKMLTRNLP